MKATAKHWVNYNGTWHPAGETFDIRKEDAETMKAFAVIQDEEPKNEPEPEPEEEKNAEPIKRGRRRKAEAE